MEGGQMVQFDGGRGKFHQQNDYHMTCRWTELDLARHTKVYFASGHMVLAGVSSFSCVTSFFCLCVCVTSLVSPACIVVNYENLP